MWDAIGKIAKVGIIIAVWQAFNWCFPLIVGGLVAYMGIKAVGSIVDAVKAGRYSKYEVDKATLKENRRRHRVNSRRPYYDRKRGWDETQLPIDMRVSSGQQSGRAYFRCAGIDRLVEGNVEGNGRATFSFITSSETKANRIGDFILSHGMRGASVKKEPDGKYRIVCDNAVDINDLAKEFYTPVDFEVKRRIETVRQYRVTGCTSYEEAEAKFRANRELYSPSNVYVVTQDTVNGVKDNPSTPSAKLDTSMLEVGEFIINETDVAVYSGNVSVSAPDDMTEAALRSDASEEFTRILEPKHMVEDKCSKEPEISNGCEKGRESLRYMMTDDDCLPLYRRDSPQMVDSGMSVYMRFSSLEDMMAVVEGRRDVSGVTVLVDTKDLPEHEGQYTLKVPLTADQFDHLRTTSQDVGELRGQYGPLGVTDSQINDACIYREVMRSGYTTARLADAPDLSDALVNGVPLREFRERVVEEDRVGFADRLSDSRSQTQWMKDASRIRDIRFDLDIRNQKLTVTSSVEGHPDSENASVVTKVETRDLTADEVTALMNRREPSVAEMKDILMRLHPNVFKTYAGRTGPLYDDPVGAYIRDERHQNAPKKDAGVRNDVSNRNSVNNRNNIDPDGPKSRNRKPLNRKM